MSRRALVPLLFVGALVAGSCAGESRLVKKSSKSEDGGTGGAVSSGGSTPSGKGGATTGGRGGTNGTGVSGTSSRGGVAGTSSSGTGGTPSGSGGVPDAGETSAGAGALGGEGGAGTDPTFTPGPRRLLSDDPTNAERDPFVLRSRDGFVYVVWSNRNVYLRRTRDGVNWSPSVRVSTGEADLYPSLYEDEAGVIHATWASYVRDQFGFYPGHIVYTRTTDPLSWDPEAEISVSAPADRESDSMPAIARTSDGILAIVFARDNCYPGSYCFSLRAITSPDGVTWSSPAVVADTMGERDVTPYLARFGSTLVAVWNRTDNALLVPTPSPVADIFYSWSNDGSAWAEPIAVTRNDAEMVSDTSPSIFADHQGAGWALWVTGSGASASVVARNPASSGVPRSVQALPAMGYSHRIVATPVPGVYLGAWVEGLGPESDIYTRVFQF